MVRRTDSEIPVAAGDKAVERLEKRGLDAASYLG
jgi:hypothetical protein